ncbi:MAG: polymerase, sigma-24 subunit, subfamily [Actinomycetia bacterium]|nr:polymerase, sigma-24 subunit, subfamily [Actinomycetes bacterium]
MAGWPGIEDIDDRRLAASLHGAGGKALTQIYESYGARLYDYCHTYLRDQVDAADAVHDSLIAAQQHIAKLHEPEHLRGWLYAIARKECLRRLDDPQVRTERHEAPLADDDIGLEPRERARRAEIRELVFSALATLIGRQREAVILTARHDLDTWQLARVLGVSLNQATELIEQASGDLEIAFTAALIARTGREDCPSVNALIDGWPPTPDAYKRLIRHIDACPMCGERHQRKVPARRLLQLLPAAQIPTGLWREIYTTTSAPESRGRRLALARRAEPFDASGWPAHEAQSVSAQRAPRARRRLWPGLAAAACGLLAIGTAVVVLQGGSTASTGDQALAAPGKVSRHSGSPKSPGTAGTPRSTTGRPSTTPTPTPTPTPTHTASPTPTPPKPRPQPTKTKPTKPPAPGTLAVSGCHMRSGNKSCAITVTANGGPVNWSVTGSSGVRASGGGDLSAGQSTEVTVSRQGWCIGQGSGSVSFSPNGVANVTWDC